jgi:hypothetical protein
MLSGSLGAGGSSATWVDAGGLAVRPSRADSDDGFVSANALLRTLPCGRTGPNLRLRMVTNGRGLRTHPTSRSGV